MLKEDYVSLEVAKLLKEKGFNISLDSKNWICCMYDENGNAHWGIYDENWCFRITRQMAMKWLREEKRTSIIIEFDLTKRGYCPYVHQLDHDMDWVVKWRVNTPMKYEEAVEAALKYVLENLI